MRLRRLSSLCFKRRMRRSRISIKPNVRPGGRAVGPTAENKTSQESVDNTQQTIKGEQIDRPPPSTQSHLDVIEPAVSKGNGNVPSCLSEKTSVNTDDRVPSSASTPAAPAPQRRNRISATPNLTRPKIHSVPRSSTGKAAASPSVPSKSSPETSTPPAITKDDSQNSTFSDSTNKQTTSTSSPCLPSGCHEPYVKKTSVPEFPSSIKPQREVQTPQKNPNEDSGSKESCSPYVKLSRCDGPGSPLKNSDMSDKQRVLRALKLKELMKLETRKERTKRKSGRHSSEYSEEVDRSKMTLADYIYYLPETNPMKSALSADQTPAETIVPPSPKLPTKMAVAEEEDDDDYDDGEDELMVPKVRVAEDGSLILDEESLTVRVQRTSDTVVENASPMFERGNTTTYMSFRKYSHVKCWSVRETDMFYLAISMVGTDFSMMAQLLTHRTRAEIKSKFKKEERTNAWRVDKAFRNKRPFDQEFFSFLLKRILEKDKDKGKSIKLVVKANKAKKGKGGKRSKKHKNANDELDTGDLEKENEDSSNVKGSDITSSTSKKCKRKRNTEPKLSSCEKTCKPSKNHKKKSKLDEGKESESLHVEDESVNAENEDPSLMTVSKKKRKRLGKSEEKKCEEEPEEKRKTKRKKESVEVQDEDPVNIDGENDLASTEHKSADPSEICKRSKKCKEEPAKGKRKTKKSKKTPEECAGENELDAVAEISTAAPDAEEDQGEELTSQTTAQEEIQQNSSKRSKRPLPDLPKRKGKKCSETKAQVEDEAQDENCGETENELRINSLAESQLQKQAIVVLERTPPRLIKTREWSESPDQPQTSQSLQDSPGRQMRAEKVKRNLTALEGVTEEMEDYQAGLESDTSAEDMTMDALSCKEDIQESQAAYQHEEDLNVHHLNKINDQTLLKSPVELVSHEEVNSYLMVNTKTTEENSTTSKNQLEAVSTKVNTVNVEEHVDGPEEKSSSGVSLEERVMLHPEMKESGSCSSQSNLSWSPQISKTQRPLNLQTTESSKEETTNALNKSLDILEEQPTSSETQEILDEKSQDDAQITDDNLSFTSDEETPTVNIKVVQEILSFLEKPDHLLTTPSDEDVPESEGQLEIDPAQTCKKTEQVTDLEDCDSDSETMTEEPLELKGATPTRQSAEGSVVSAQQSIIPEWQSKPIPYLRQASQIMVNSQQTREPHEDSISEIADESGCQSPAKAMHCEPDLSMKDISTEDKLVSCEVNLQKCEEAKDPLTPVHVLGTKPTSGPSVSLENTATGKIETNPVFTDAIVASTETCSQISPEVLSASFSDDPTAYSSNTCDMNTMLFSAEDSKDVNYVGEMQPLNTDSVRQDLSKASEDLIAPLKGDAELEIKDSAGMESDNQTEEEPTFILTLYEIPTSQLFHEASFGPQDMSSYDLHPAEVFTPHLASDQSQSIPSTLNDSSSLLHMKSEEIEKHVSSVSQKVVDHSSIPDSGHDASLQLISSQKSSFDVDASLDLRGSQEILSRNASVPTDVTEVLQLDKKPSGSTETKASSQRRSRIKVKPNLRPCVKAGPSKAGPSKCALMQKTSASVHLPTSNTAAKQVEIESNQKTSSQETVGFHYIHSDLEESERETHPGHGSVLSTTPASEDIKEDIHIKWKNIFNTDILMGNDTALDLSVKNVSDVPDLHNTDIEESKKEVEDPCGGSSHLVLVDAFALASGDMDDTRLLKAFENRRLLSTVNDQKENSADVSKEPEASDVTSASQDGTEPFISTWTKEESSRQKQPDIESNQTLQPQIKKEIDKVEERTEQEDLYDNLSGDSGAMLTLPDEVIKTKQQLTRLTDAMTSTRAETQPVEETTGKVLPNMVTEEKKDEVYMKSESPSVHLQSCEDPYVCAIEKQQSLTKEEDQEVEEHEAVSHMMLDDIFVPVSEGVEDDLTQEIMTVREESSHEAKRSQVKEHLTVSELKNATPFVSPKRRMATKKGLLKVKMIFPKKRSGESTSPSKQHDVYNLQSNSEESESSTKISTPCGSEIKETLSCADRSYTKSLDTGEACEGVSHTVLSDIFVPVLDESHETASSQFHQEALLVVKSVTERPDTKRKVVTASRSAEQNIPSCRRDCTITPTAHSLDTQAEDEWSLKSDMLPVDSNEIENWCEGVSHMLLSDAFVPVSEEEHIIDQKGFGASGAHKDREYAVSLPEFRRTSDNAKKEHQVGSISDIQKPVDKLKEKPPASQTKKSPGRQSTFQMTLRSPERSPKNQLDVLKSAHAVPKTPQRAKENKESRVQTPTKSPKIPPECRIQLERLSLEEICKRNLQPKHHSTPVNVKTSKARMTGFASHAAQEPAMPAGAWPKVVLNRMNIKAIDADSSTPTSSPARASTSAYQPLDDYQSPHSSPHESDLDADEEPASVSQFFLDDIFTEVVDED
nr:transcription factor TFIIIB component B'' homolog isoform X5 [Misgurnus anguillicaudatus]